MIGWLAPLFAVAMIVAVGLALYGQVVATIAKAVGA